MSAVSYCVFLLKDAGIHRGNWKQRQRDFCLLAAEKQSDLGWREGGRMKRLPEKSTKQVVCCEQEAI